MGVEWFTKNSLTHLLELIKSKIPTKMSQLESDVVLSKIEDSYWSENTVYSSSKTRSLIPIGLGSPSQPVYFDWNGKGQCGYLDTKTALGLYAGADEYNTVAIGMAASSKGVNATSVGYSSQSSGESAVSVGFNAKGSGNYSVALGQDARAGGTNSISIGKYSESTENCVAIGCNAKSTNEAVALGTNANATKGQVFAIGNGGDYNAFEIRQGELNGDTSGISIKLEPAGMYLLRVSAFDNNGFFYGASSREFVSANGGAYWWKPCTEIRANDYGDGGYVISYPADSSVSIKCTSTSIYLKYSITKLG